MPVPEPAPAGEGSGPRLVKGRWACGGAGRRGFRRAAAGAAGPGGAARGGGGAGGVVGIHAIGGMAGVGKPTLAVHAAHGLAGSFPDGQFFLPLHAHTTGQRPVEPADALASLLLTAGVPAQQIPPDAQARASRWRNCVAGKKILLLLADAARHG